MMTIEEIRTGKEGQTFDLKSIQIDPKALAIPSWRWPMQTVVCWQLAYQTRQER